MAEMTYRQAVADAIAEEMARDQTVVLIGEDIAAAGGVFKATEGLFDRFGPNRVWDTPISEQAIIGAAMGGAMTGIRPVAEIMFSDFVATCWDGIANEIAKMRYMTGGQISLPLVIRCGNGGGLRFGAQHSQSIENWAMAVPGLKVVCPSTPADVKGLLTASIRDDDPVIFCEHKALYSVAADVPAGEHVVPLGQATRVRDGSDLTLLALGRTVQTAVDAAEEISARHGLEAEVLDLRTLVPLDVTRILQSLEMTGRLIVVEETTRPLGWGAAVSAIIMEEAFDALNAPVMRVSTDPIPLPASPALEDLALPSIQRVVDVVMKLA